MSKKIRKYIVELAGIAADVVYVIARSECEAIKVASPTFLDWGYSPADIQKARALVVP